MLTRGRAAVFPFLMINSSTTNWEKKNWGKFANVVSLVTTEKFRNTRLRLYSATDGFVRRCVIRDASFNAGFTRVAFVAEDCSLGNGQGSERTPFIRQRRRHCQALGRTQQVVSSVRRVLPVINAC